MDPCTRDSFAAELTKLASRRDVTQMLSSLAERKGLRPSMIPSIKQVGNIASRGPEHRSRAAEVARNVRGFLKSKPSGQAAA